MKKSDVECSCAPRKKKKVIADEIQLPARRKLAGDFNLGSDVVICSFD